MKTTRAVLAVIVGLARGATAQINKQPGEVVDMKSLPTSVQQTINQRAAGGEIVRVKREDDVNGKWNYEVVVKKDGQEWGFEVDPDGKFPKKAHRNQKITGSLTLRLLCFSSSCPWVEDLSGYRRN